MYTEATQTGDAPGRDLFTTNVSCYSCHKGFAATKEHMLELLTVYTNKLYFM